MARRIERPTSIRELLGLAYEDCGVYVEYLSGEWKEALSQFLSIRYGPDFILEFGPGKKPEHPAGIGLHAKADPTADIWRDLNRGIPLASGLLQGVYGNQFLEHLRTENKVYFFNEVGRVLRVGGTAEFKVPHYLSPDADGDPTHLSRWSEHSFRYYCIDERTGKPFVDGFSSYGLEYLFEMVHHDPKRGRGIHVILKKIGEMP